MSFQGELFPADSRSFGNSILLFFQFVSSFVMIKVAPLLILSIGIYGLFWLFSAVVFFMFIFNLIFMPETKGRSLAEIENYYANERRWGNEEKSSKGDGGGGGGRPEKVQEQQDEKARVKAEIKRINSEQKMKC